MTPPDYSSWLTKQQAADRIGVTTKSVERFVQAGQIQQARWQREGRGPLLAVYHPDDVARIAKERAPGPLPAFLVPGLADVPANGNGHGSLSPLTPINHLAVTPAPIGSGEDLFRALVTAAVHVVSETSQTSVSQTLFVTVAEASALTGLTQAYLVRAIEDKSLPAIRDRGWRIRRKDLEQL